MDMAVVTRIELVERGLQPGSGRVLGPATLPARATAQRGGAGRRDLGPRPL